MGSRNTRATPAPMTGRRAGATKWRWPTGSRRSTSTQMLTRRNTEVSRSTVVSERPVRSLTVRISRIDRAVVKAIPNHGVLRGETQANGAGVPVGQAPVYHLEQRPAGLGEHVQGHGHGRGEADQQVDDAGR